MKTQNGWAFCLLVVTIALCLSSCCRAVSRNFVSDPEFRLGATYWAVTSPRIQIIGSRTGSAGFVQYVGHGQRSGYEYVVSVPITLEAGHVYTLAGYIDAVHAISGRPSWAIFDSALKTKIATAALQAGFSARVRAAFQLPSGISSVRVLCDTNNAVIAKGKVLTCSAPTLQAAAFGGSDV